MSAVFIQNNTPQAEFLVSQIELHFISRYGNVGNTWYKYNISTWTVLIPAVLDVVLNVGFKHNRSCNCVATEVVQKLASFLYISLLTIRAEKEKHSQKCHVGNCEMQPQLKNIIYMTILSFE